MAKVSAKVSNERREKVWFLLLRGKNQHSIAKILHVPDSTIHYDVKFLTKKSKQFLYDVAKGTHVLLYQRAIEGIGLTLSLAYDKFYDKKISETQKPAYLRLTMEAHEKMMQLVVNGPTVIAVEDLTRRAERLGIRSDITDIGTNNNISNESEN